MKKRADWLGWTMHGLFGLIVGTVIGFVVFARLHRRAQFQSDLLLAFLIGAALVGAGLGSRFGDRLWLGDSYHMLPPDEPEQSHLSDWLSWTFIAVGTATCVITLLKFFRVV